MNRFLKLLPLAALAVLGLLALVPGGPANDTPPVRAAISSSPAGLSASGGGFFSGGTVNVFVKLTDDDGTLTVTASGATLPTLTVSTCQVTDSSYTPTGPTASCPTGVNGNPVTVNTNTLDATATPGDKTLITLSLTATCATDATILVNASQDGVSTLGTPTPTAGVQISLQCAATGTVTPTTPTVTGTPATATPTATLTSTVPGQVIVSVAPTTILCNGSAFVTVVVRTVQGALVSDGNLVTLSTTIGTFPQSSGGTFGGGVLAVITAPSTSGGIATITATSGGISNTTQLTINCTAPAPTSPPPPPAPASVVRPPSTGDAGLANGGSGWTLFAGFGAIAASLLGALVVIRQRA